MKTAEDIINEKGTKTFSVPSSATVYDAIKVMVENNIGSILVEENNNKIGIWTERDLLKNSLNPNFDPKTAKITDYMTSNLKKIPHSTSIYKILDIFLGLRIRRLIVEKDEVFFGLLSIGDVIKAALVEKTKEYKELHEMASWEYYENWRWKA